VVLVGDTASVPLAAFVPVQPLPAVHEVALVEDQVTVEILPELMLVGLAENATVGGAGKGKPHSTASTAGEASTKGESAIVETIALASRCRALRSEETKTKRTCITPNQSKAIAILDCEANQHR
jgi:hypothetical protein